MLYGTNLEYTKAFNYRIVLETIRRMGPLSRAEVARQTGLTAQTVSNITRGLIDSNLVEEAERTRVGRGAPATNLVINADGAYSIGLDLDEEHLTGVLIDLGGNLRKRVTYDVPTPDPEAAMLRMIEAANTLIAEGGLDRSQIWGVGVGVPGPFQIWASVPVIETVQRELGIRVLLENNATAAAVAERWYGAGRDVSTFFYLFFGLGLGGGLIIDGHPYEGSQGNAGEIGYISAPFPSDGIRVFDDPHLGIYFNMPRLRRRLEEAGHVVESLEDLVDLLAEENPILRDWLTAGGQRLAAVIPIVGYVVDPEAIIFGGRLPDELLDALMEEVERCLPDHMSTAGSLQPRLIRGRAGADATALGVATMPIYESFAPAPNVLLKNSHPRFIEDGPLERQV